MPQVKIRISSEESQRIQGQVDGQAPTTVSRERIATASLFAHQAINTAKQIVNYNISNIGVRTGNYVLQEQINQAIDIVSDVATVGMGFAAGGFVGGAIAVAGVTTKQIFKNTSYVESLRHENIQSEYLAKRSGNSTTGGSRETEN